MATPANKISSIKAALPKMFKALGAELAVSVQAGAVDNIQARLHTGSGALKRSTKGSTQSTSDGVEIKLTVGGGSKDLPYARIQEEGGIVRPKNAKFLAIPVGPARTASGVARFASPRDVPGLTFVQSRRGQPLLVKFQDERNSKGRLKARAGTVYFILRRQVTIKGVHYARDAVQAVYASIPSRLQERTDALLRAA